MRFLILISIISLLFQACQQSPDVILDQEYLTFLNPKSLEASEKKLKEQLAYWTEKLELQPENQVYMQKVAALKSQEFKITHELSALDTSDNILKELRLRCDPFGRNEKLDQMVVVGHSMGGLMSYLMTVDSEDKLWNALSRIPVNQIQANDRAHSEIQRVFFFESDRSIDRIVTIASPFNGSGYANMFTRWLGGSLVSLPNTTSELSQLIFRQNNQSVWDRMFAPRTSLDSLNKNSAILKLVSETTVPEGVKHHNIAGFKNNDTLEEGTDGVVKLRSAIRPNVDSEIKIKAAHSEVHRQPAASHFQN